MVLKEMRFIAVLVFYCAVTYRLYLKINETQPTPFIDETFHVRQVKLYCEGIFSEWDEKITTLPGLYLFTTGVHGLFEFFGMGYDCSLFGLRGLNAIVSVANFFLLHSILHVIRGRQPQLSDWEACNLAMFPTLYLFSFFYYTDTLSLFAVLLMFRFHLELDFTVSSLAGLFSVIVRQTNILWVCFFAADLMFANVQLKEVFNIRFSKTHFFNDIKKIMKKLLFNWAKFVSLFGYLIVILIFFIYVLVNGDIVVGDKSAHQPTLHMCQLFYFLIFSTVFMFPTVLTVLPSFGRLCLRYVHRVLIIVFVMCVVVHYNTIAHPYLLADNRHYAFYVWKNVYQHIGFRYMLVPFYMLGFYTISVNIDVPSGNWIYWITTILLLMPCKLLEFRYFIIPYIMARIYMRPRQPWQLALETILYCLINGFTVYVFVTKKFYWSDSNEIQRIIW